MPPSKRTPCVGICSTTYGDLVCRGCKRFAHEIVAWNGYDEPQREQIRARLHQLRHQVVAQHVQVVHPMAFALACRSADIIAEEMTDRIHHMLQYLLKRGLPLAAGGLSGVADPDAEPGAPASALAAMQAIDAEIYARSLAFYERSFKVTV